MTEAYQVPAQTHSSAFPHPQFAKCFAVHLTLMQHCEVGMTIVPTL